MEGLEEEVFKQDKISDELICERILGAVGLARKAGKCATGTSVCVDYMRADKGKLLIIADDISENTLARLVNTAKYHGIPYINTGIRKAFLAKRLGKTSDTAAVLLLDEGFVKIIEKLGIEIHTTYTEVLD